VKTLFRHLLEEEFRVDARPLPVYFSPKEDQDDLLTLSANMLKDNDRLEELNRQLESRKASPHELEKLFKGILPTLDGFDRVLHLARNRPQTEEMDNWLKSIESIYFRLLNLLEQYGLFQLKSVGSKVDLNVHDVVEYRPSADHENDTVISDRQKGYVFKGKLLRDAKVVVAYNERR
jgi:molecular chaperone GrpE